MLGETNAPQEALESEFIDFACPSCGNLVSFMKPDAGKLRQCPHCLESMIVPAHSGSPPEPIPFPIRTERLLLRRLQPLDAPDIADLTSDSTTLRYVGWETMSLEAVEEWIANQSHKSFPNSEERSYLALEAIEPARTIGVITFSFWPDKFNLARFEIIIHRDWQRKGYATEAVHGLLCYLFKGLRVRRVIAECDSRDFASRRLLLKSGLRQESECIQDHELKGEWVDTLGFALLKHEYEANSLLSQKPS